MSSAILPISAYLIVKNEENYIKKCIDSLTNVVSEIIINDTGSSDKTLEIISSYPNIKLIQSQWKNDF